MIKMQAPAKLNLTLEILGKRDDGFHELKSVIQTVSLCDTLTFEEDNEIVYHCNTADWYAEKSLVSKAVTLLMQKTGYDGGVSIGLEKRIPLMAGLGGDSSDAAVVLMGLNQHWKLRFTKRELATMAAELGSDVPFFIYGGTCLMEGRGEKISSLFAVTHRWVLIVTPTALKKPDKTKNAYAKIQPAHYTDGAISAKMVAAIGSKQAFDDSLLYNAFENISFAGNNELAIYREHILRTGAPHVHLAGAGPSLFTVLQDRKQADDLFMRLSNQGMEAYLTETRPESLD
ncbi:MAG: 4-(cytidine 5'-diphospho)-2-C-methyl-D-erythritol kinase [Dehalococcoidales bacterium]|nr:4-(cytidine 5'-diphospho)-2-C-methyl-D-erythritol kinase [Dehalococcoidales bacterium]